MITSLTNHLWQSTLMSFFAMVIAMSLYTYRAEVRFWVWFCASMKFLFPFSVFVTAGEQIGVLTRTKGVSVPIATSIPHAEAIVPLTVLNPLAIRGTPQHMHVLYPFLFGIWLAGASLIVFLRIRTWMHVRASVSASQPWTGADLLTSENSLPIRISKSLRALGVVGIRRPVLLMPEGIDKHLSALELQSLIAHEVCHVSRHDNLAATMHMIVETLFWFHPIVWWIGACLLNERERACDEYVLTVGKDSRAYAEGILNVCRFYAESPLACLSSISSSTNVKKRIEKILNRKIGRQLNLVGKAALTLAASVTILLPISIGLAAPPLRAENTDVICSPSDPTIALELQSADDEILRSDQASRETIIRRLSQELVAHYPDNFIVHVRYQQWMFAVLGRQALADQYRQLAAQHPGDPMFRILYAQTLRYLDQPLEAIKMLEGAPGSQFDPWVHLTLAELYSWTSKKDLPKARAQLDSWFAACPSTLNWNALESLVEYGSSETSAKEAGILRTKLELENDPHLLLSWPFVWRLELKIRPEPGRTALGQQIAADVKVLEQIPTPDDPRWPQLLAVGRSLANDTAGR